MVYHLYVSTWTHHRRRRVGALVQCCCLVLSIQTYGVLPVYMEHLTICAFLARV